MNPEDIIEIIRVQLVDAGVTALEEHFNIAIDYYNEFNIIPHINYIIGMAMHDQHGENEDQNPHNNFEPVQLIAIPIGQNIDNNNNPNTQSIIIQNNSNIQAQDSDSDDENEIPNSSVNQPPESQNENNDDDIDVQLITSRFQNLIVKKVIDSIGDLKLAIVKENTEYNTECMVCYDNFVLTDLVRILPCNHVAHRSCIDDYLQKESHLCPMCKKSGGKYKLINL